MANTIDFILTNAASELISKVLSGKTLNFTRMAVGDGFSYDLTAAKGYATLVNEVLSLDITKKETLTASSVRITSAFKNTDAEKEFYYREVGLYAQDPDTGEEILYAYGNRNDAAELITPTGTNVVTKQLAFIISVGDSAKVTFNVNAGVYALQEDITTLQTSLHELNQNKADQANVSVLETRVNTLVALPNGSTTGDAELIDARIDFKGNTKDNVGDHIRSVSGQLSQKIDNIGALKRYSLTSYSGTFVLSDTVLTNVPIFFNPISTTVETVTALILYGMYGETNDDGYDNLGIFAFGTKNVVVPTRAYHHLQVGYYPYISGNSSTVAFDLLQSDYGIQSWLYNTNNAIKVESERIDDLEENVINIKDVNALNKNTYKIFKKVVCCGDSYTSGHIVTKDGVAKSTNEEYAYPHYMSTMSGNEWINCGHSGSNVLTWQTAARGLPKVQKVGKSQAYLVGLMINDVSNSNRHVDLGTASDIGTAAQTYYGGLSQIVVQLATISPNAKIFICTCPQTTGNFPLYNQAVYDVVDYYKNTYPIHCLDLLANIEKYQNTSLTGDLWYGHYTAIGYEQFAEILSSIMSDYINNNITDFQDVPFIEYE